MNSNPLEKDIQKRVRAYAKSFDVMSYKFSSPSQRSVPDVVFIIPGGAVFWVEFKRRGEVPTAAQRVEISKLQQQGATVYVIDNVEDGRRAVDCELMKGY